MSKDSSGVFERKNADKKSGIDLSLNHQISTNLNLDSVSTKFGTLHQSENQPNNQSRKHFNSQSQNQLENQSNNNQFNDQSNETKTLHIIHFNDVYDIEGRSEEPVGGASRFVTAVNQIRHINPLILFSGDIFNPSPMGVVTKGEQMVDVMNNIGVHYSLFGNHDFDFGVDRLSELTAQTQCTWLMSNALDVTSGEPLGGGMVSQVVEWAGVKVGLMGLIEKDWIDCLGTVDPEDVEVLDFVEEGASIAEELRAQGADVVIALSHMRWPNDVKLASEVPQIDLVLGGHDHDFTYKQLPGGGKILKSGTDFREFGHVEIVFEGVTLKDVKVTRVEVNSQVEEDVVLKKVVDKYTGKMKEEMDVLLGRMEVEMNGLFSTVRTTESNLGNFITDIMLKCTNADIAILNSGTLRSDSVHRKGDFYVRDLMSILPMADPLVLLKMSGRDVLKALENSVSKYPSREGRFAQVAGLSFGFDPTKPQGERVNELHVRVQGRCLQLDQMYRVVTKSYMAEGRDGYDVFKDAQVLMNAEDGQPLVTVVRNHFESVGMLKGELKHKSAHRQRLISFNQRMSLSLPNPPDLVDAATIAAADTSEAAENTSTCSTAATTTTTTAEATTPTRNPTSKQDNYQRRQSFVLQKSKKCLQRRHSISALEESELGRALCPMLEGRIWIVRNQEDQTDTKTHIQTDTYTHTPLISSKINEENEEGQNEE